MKKIFKFILRITVTACIVVGVVALVMHFTNKDSNLTQIADTSANLNISTKLDDSHKNLVYIVSANNTNTFDNKASIDVITAIVSVNDVLKDYYDYYITLTCYENTTDNNLKSAIIENMNNLNSNIDLSIKYLNQVNSASSTNYVEKNLRIINLFNSLCNQTETLFDTCTLLRQYVYKVNYQTNVCTSKTEAVFEMAKDYAKIAFEAEIKDNIYETKGKTILTENYSSSFKNIMSKTLTMKAETSNSTEIGFVYNYSNINNIYLNEFYKKSHLNKLSYISSISNFTEEAPEDETEEQEKARLEKAEQQQSYLTYLYDFMKGSF